MKASARFPCVLTAALLAVLTVPACAPAVATTQPRPTSTPWAVAPGALPLAEPEATVNPETCPLRKLSTPSPLGSLGLGEPEFHVGANKVAWLKPEGARLTQVTAERLDGPAPPFRALLPEGYEGFRYQASTLYFLAAGCWRLRAETDDGAVLEITVLVQPSRRFLRPPRCADLPEAVRASPWIMVGHVERTEPAPPGYFWQDVRVGSVWRAGWPGQGAPPPGTLLVVLQEETEPTLLSEGRDYLLFLHPVFDSVPTDPLGLICPAETLAEMRDDRIVPVGGEPPLWTGAQVGEVQAEVQAAAAGE